jgi:hypothetical protein
MVTELTQEYLKQVLSYDPETGVFTWLVSHAKSVKVGQRAGQADTKGYRVVGINGGRYMEPHLAWLFMTGKLREDEIYHNNGFVDDNRWTNLRSATNQENRWHRVTSKNNTSGYKGVNWNIEKQKWRANITVDYKTIFLGYFDKKEHAAQAYNVAALKYFGEFAFLNEIPN